MEETNVRWLPIRGASPDADFHLKCRSFPEAAKVLALNCHGALVGPGSISDFVSNDGFTFDPHILTGWNRIFNQIGRAKKRRARASTKPTLARCRRDSRGATHGANVQANSDERQQFPF